MPRLVLFKSFASTRLPNSGMAIQRLLPIVRHILRRDKPYSSASSSPGLAGPPILCDLE